MILWLLLAAAVILAGAYLGWRWWIAEPVVAPNVAAAAVPSVPPPLPEQAFKPLSPQEAEKANLAIVTSDLPIEPARPFNILASPATQIDQHSALDCLTAAVYYEAASETEQGQRGVAQVVLNRLRHPAFPKSVCGVVFQGAERTTGCQFTFTCDGSLRRTPSAPAWARARRIADDALHGRVESSVGMATHYHTVWVLPYWASSLAKITTIGAHIFYRWDGYWGKRQAFVGQYAGREAATQLSSPDSLLPFDTSSLVLPPDVLSGAPATVGPKPEGPLIEDRRTEDSTLPANRLNLPDAKKPLADQTAGTLKADDGQAGKIVAPPGAPPR
ncbi:MAG: cell wall hydrolase [Proteobacteria bacterium]|nr:cell wall hydrolase [Pseudomonadota bacterium]